MEPFYFGELGQRLYGAYHPPSAQVSASLGIVLCYPIGQEAIRSHRAFFRLAELLSSCGMHVLRFDYFGCGDSDGCCEDTSMRQCLLDIHRAIKELRSGSGAQDICLIGLRLGGFLALEAGLEAGNNIERLVLWDAVVDGKVYLREAATSHKQWLEGSFAKAQPPNNGKSAREAHGFPISDVLYQEIEAANLDRISRKPANRILMIDTQTAPDKAKMKAHLEGLGTDVTYKHVASFPVWTKSGDEIGNKGVVPATVLDHIVSWMTDSAT